MKLNDAATALAIDIAFWMEAVADPDYPIAELAICAYELCPKLRALGITLLVTDGNVDGFLHNLIRSGRVWRTYLRRAAIESASDHHFCSGRFFALVDSIAAGDMSLARDIATVAPPEFRSEHEYEDDWCCGQLFQLLLELKPNPIVETLIVRLENYVQADFHSTVDLARSFVTRDQSDFNEAFQQFLDHRQMEIENKIKFGQLLDVVVEANRRVSLEALAWLRLADIHGFTTESEYSFCPSIARLPMQSGLPEDADPQMSDWLR